MSSIFKKFTLGNINQLAATPQKKQKEIRAAVVESFPAIDDDPATWELILPKKQELMLVPCSDSIELICLATPEDNKTFQILFFQTEGGILPHLRVLQKFPWMLPKHQVDVGGCKFVVSGAPVMAPGLTHKTGGKVAPGISVGDAVAVYIEGKQHAVSVGFAAQTTKEIIEKSENIAVENTHHLGDGLWYLDKISQSSLVGQKKK